MHRWKISVLAAAAIVSAGLYTTDAQALALGQIHVRSALGEPLRADIDLPQITPAEADSLKASTATPSVYRSQGLEYTSAINDVRVRFERRPDGSGVLRLTSSKPINDPFVDLVIDASWAAGHIVRSYTMLLDPPELRRAAPPVVSAPQITAPSQQAAVVESDVPSRPAPLAVDPTRPPMPAPAVVPRPAPRVATVPAPAASAGDVQVKRGETAGRIAGAHLPAGVSLDQMLVAMMRANPDAFVNGNINRLRSGAVLQMPTEAQAQATPTREARRIIAAQSRDFNEFRRRLAASAPAADVGSPQRAAAGSVQSQVQDQKPASASADKLTLSKGGVKAQKADEKLARDRQSDQNTERMAELQKNISDLNKLSTDAGGAPAKPAAAASSAAANVPAVATVPVANPVAVPASAAASAAAVAVEAASAATVAASAAVEAASAVAAAPAPAKPPVVVAAPAPVEEPSFLDELLEDPIKLGGIGLVLAALLGYVGFRSVQRRKAQAAMPVDSSVMDSQLQPDSFFGASGGQRVDTANSGLSTGSSSLAYSPSQLDAGEVDPVAEADVYLAYGRDLQAEEILREAARVTPERTSIYVKLGEIYSKRQDRKALEAVAKELQGVSQGQGADWARMTDLGRALDPDNLLYQAAASRSVPGAAAAAAAVAAVAVSSRAHDLDLDAPSTLPVEFPPAPAPVSAGLPAGLDLDLDLDPTPAASAPANWTAPQPPAAAPALPKLPDFELPPLNTAAPAAPQSNALEFKLDDLDSFSKPATSASPAPSMGTDELNTAKQPLEFDLGGLSLDLNPPAPPAAPVAPVAPAAPVAPMYTETAPAALAPMQSTAPAPLLSTPIPDDPLATKLALAEEFNAIGDSEGARALVEEVIADATGELKARAQRMLITLG